MPPVPKPPTAKSGRNRTLLIGIGVAAVVAAALIVGSIVLTSGGDNSSSSSSASAPTTTAGGKPAAVALVAGIPQNGTILGSPNAQVRVLQYEDLQCPICKRYTDDAFPSIVNEYVKPGRLRLDFRGLAFLGPDSVKALRIALAAGKQNKLWDVVGLLYADQGEENSGWVTDAKIDEILAQVPGLDAAKVKKDAQSAAITKQMQDLSAEATQNGVQGTPSFFIARGVNQPFPVQVTSLTPDGFRPVLDDALQG
jgi:protein-disulfide isomerase